MCYEDLSIVLELAVGSREAERRADTVKDRTGEWRRKMPVVTLVTAAPEAPAALHLFKDTRHMSHVSEAAGVGFLSFSMARFITQHLVLSS